MSTLFRMIRTLRPYYAQVIFLLLCVVVVIAASLVTPSIIQFVIDQGVVRQDANVMVQAGLLVAGVGLGRALFNFPTRYTAEAHLHRPGSCDGHALIYRFARCP